MDLPRVDSLPFLTRKMLNFEHAQKLGLKITGHSRVATTLTIRGITREGVFNFNVDTQVLPTVTPVNVSLPDFPIMLTVSAVDSTILQGDCFAQVVLTVNDDPIYELTTGYVYNAKSLSWPVNNGLDLWPGKGGLRELTGSNPAAGAEILVQVPVGRIWKIHMIQFELVCAAAAASRRPHLQFFTASGPVADVFSNVDQIISETKTYSCLSLGNVPDETDNGVIIISMPHDLYLPAEGGIQTVTTNLQGGDNYGPPTLLVEEYFQRQS